jgi:SIR2-like domain
MAVTVGEAAEGAVSHPGDSPVFQRLVESVRDGKCILFLGAGVHYPPPDHSPYTYLVEERPPLGGALAKKLAMDCDFVGNCPNETDDNLQRVALCYEKVLGRRELVERIRQEVEEHSKPSAALRALAELPFPLVMTTNYDTLFERALRQDHVGKDPFVGVYSPDRYQRTPDYPGGDLPTANRPFVFKVHGAINVPDSLVVTDEDYITFVLRMNNEGSGFHPIPETFLYWLNKWPTLFVGYRLLDFNLRLLFRTLRWRLDAAQQPNSYSVDLRPDPLVSELWTKQHGLRFIVEDVWQFVPRLYSEVMSHEMPQ